MAERVTVELEKRQYSFMVETVDHFFGTNQTISGAIKLHNQHHIKNDKMNLLLEVFNILNNHQIPKVGSVFKIPIIPR